MNVEHGSAGDMHTTQSRLSCGATRRRCSENQNSQMLARGKDDVSTVRLAPPSCWRYMLLYTPFDRKHEVARRMTELGAVETDFTFTRCGLETWRVPARSTADQASNGLPDGGLGRIFVPDFLRP